MSTPSESVEPPTVSREGFCTDPDCGPGVRHDPGSEPPILPRDEWDKYADEDATDNLPRYRRGGRGSEPPIESEEIPSSTPCEECGRPACWLCSADRGEVTLCDDCYAKVRHLWMPHRWFLARCHDCTPVLDIPFREQSERDGWATEHVAGTGHHVELLTARPSNE